MADVLNTVLLVAITTSKMFFPGISIIPNDEAADVKIDGARSFIVTLQSETAPSGSSYAQLEVPKELGVGEKVSLYIDRRTENNKEKSQEEIIVDRTPSTKLYWGCGEAIPEGQPINHNINALPEGFLSDLKDKKDYKTLAYWPAIGGRPVKPSLNIQGNYKLTTNFIGSTSFEIDETQKYMDVVKIMNLQENPDTKSAMVIRWRPVEGARAYLVTANGGNMFENVMWTSSKNKEAANINFRNTPIDDEMIKKLIEEGVLLSADVTECTIPSGVFDGYLMALVNIEAIGKDKTINKDGITTHIITRSNAGALLFQQIEGPALDPNAN
ncbi:MAG: hypothetical protein SNJ70_03015 [Armatimonadota bacterium]